MVSLVTSVVNIVVPHAAHFWVFALYTWLVYYNLHNIISLLLTGNYNVCKIHSFILVCGCNLKKTKKKSNIIVGALGSTWDHEFCMGTQNCNRTSIEK